MTLCELGLLQYINIALVPTAIYTILKYHKYRRNVCENCCIDPSREANKSLMQNVAYLKGAITYNNELYVSELHRIDDEHDKFHEGLIKENERLRERLKERHIVLIPKRCMEKMNDTY